MQTPSNHLPHLLMFVHAIERLRAGRQPLRPGISIPSELFLMREEGDSFWELVGLSVRGLPSLLLAGLRFRRQSGESGDLSRESLVSYLSSNLREVRIDRAPKPPHLLEVMVPGTREPILHTLKAARSGAPLPVALIDREDVRFAFDLRLENPSRSHHRTAAPVGTVEERFLFRTDEGHVLSAQPHRLPSKLHKDDRFLALTRTVQHTATHDHPLPTLVMHRSMLTMTAPIHDDATNWLHRSLPFHSTLANPTHLLDPDLESYRLFRDRESREVREEEERVKAAG